MEIKINDIKYDININAITPVRYFLKFRESCQKAFVEAAGDEKKQTEILTKLVYTALNDSSILFSDFNAETKKDSSFFVTAFLIFTIIFENNFKSRGGKNYGIEYNELTFLALFGKSGLPEMLLKEALYYDIIEIMTIQNDLQNPDTYSHRLASPDEAKAAMGIDEATEKELSEFLKKQGEANASGI